MTALSLPSSSSPPLSQPAPSLQAQLRAAVLDAVRQLQATGTLPTELPLERIVVEPTRDPAHGDLATNVAMVLAKPAGLAPRAVGEAVAALLAAAPSVAGTALAGPGFLNVTLEPDAYLAELRALLRAGLDYGRSDVGAGQTVNVEYVSANPTGPLHIGHARGMVVGDALARLLAKTGHEVVKEFYVNDAGAQVEKLARTVHLRYREALGEAIGDIPEGMYPGDYLKDVGQTLAERHGDRYASRPEAEWLDLFKRESTVLLMDDIKRDLAAAGVHHDFFTSEAAIVASGTVEAALATLEAKGLVYEGVLEPPKGKAPEDWEPRPQTLFRSTAYGDDVDRPLKKSTGSWAYFTPDIAYHFDKLQRGATQIIDVLGADHAGYVKRIQAAVQALSDGKATVDVKVCQLVHILKDGQPFKVSKRAGNIVTLRDVIDAVGAGVLRFIMLTRRNDQTLEFDVTKVTEQSRENPVFYVQYAHARCASVLRRAAEEPAYRDIAADAAHLAEADLTPLLDGEMLALVKRLAAWPDVVAGAALSHEPHRIAFYLQELAAAFHQLYNRGADDAEMRFLLPHDPAATAARLALVVAVKTVLAAGLDVIGVAALEELRA